MALPKIEHPINEVYLMSLDKKVRFRPFLVKEEKLLLIAKESEERDDVKNAIIQVLQNCCLDEININDLPLFDIEMFFVHLRIKSIGDSAKLSFTCKNILDDTSEIECGHVTDYSLDLNKIKYEVPPEHNSVVKLSPTIGIKLKYPTISVLSDDVVDEYTAAMRVITDNIDYIYDADSVYKRDSISEEELANFLEELSVDQIAAIRGFFSATPRAVLEDTINCGACGFEHKIHVGDLYSFFT